MKRMVTILAPVLLAAFSTAAQQSGSLEFSTRVTPSAGRAEPARGMSVFLLRKSFADIQKEAEADEPKPDLAKFVDELEISKELKDWIKRTGYVTLTGGEFRKKATVDDVFDVPEFFQAYIIQNAGDPRVPEPKYTLRDRDQSPERYERLRQEYRERLRKFARENTHTLDGIDLHLAEVDPGQRWTRLEHDRRNRSRFRAIDAAQSKYLVARAESNLDGRGAIANIPPGEYWLSTLNDEAVAGDTRLRWDTPVKIAAGRATRIELSNVNSVSAK